MALVPSLSYVLRKCRSEIVKTRGLLLECHSNRASGKLQDVEEPRVVKEINRLQTLIDDIDALARAQRARKKRKAA